MSEINLQIPKSNIQRIASIRPCGTDEGATGRFYGVGVGDHVYSVPSVTTVISKFTVNNAWLEQWRKNVGAEAADRISKIASTKGSAMHDHLERLLNGESFNRVKIPSNIVGQVCGITDILRANVTQIHAVESFLFSPVLRIAGRCDLIADWQGSPAIIDFKTSKRPKHREDINDYFTQCSLYAMMAKYMYGINCTKLVIIIGVDFSNPQVFECNIIKALPEAAKIMKAYKESELWENVK